LVIREREENEPLKRNTAVGGPKIRQKKKGQGRASTARKKEVIVGWGSERRGLEGIGGKEPTVSIGKKKPAGREEDKVRAREGSTGIRRGHHLKKGPEGRGRPVCRGRNEAEQGGKVGSPEDSGQANLSRGGRENR